jgi:hypothetical protein
MGNVEGHDLNTHINQDYTIQDMQYMEIFNHLAYHFNRRNINADILSMWTLYVCDIQ